LDLMLKTDDSYKTIYCPQCSPKLEELSSQDGLRLFCNTPECSDVNYDNPIPVIAIIVETKDGSANNFCPDIRVVCH